MLLLQQVFYVSTPKRNFLRVDVPKESPSTFSWPNSLLAWCSTHNIPLQIACFLVLEQCLFLFLCGEGARSVLFVPLFLSWGRLSRRFSRVQLIHRTGKTGKGKVFRDKKRHFWKADRLSCWRWRWSRYMLMGITAFCKTRISKTFGLQKCTVPTNWSGFFPNNQSWQFREVDGDNDDFQVWPIIYELALFPLRYSCCKLWD